MKIFISDLHLGDSTRTDDFHKFQLKHIKQGIYANCGAWTVDAEPTYIACDKNKITFRKVNNHKLIKQIFLKG